MKKKEKISRLRGRLYSVLFELDKFDRSEDKTLSRKRLRSILDGDEDQIDQEELFLMIREILRLRNMKQNLWNLGIETLLDQTKGKDHD